MVLGQGTPAGSHLASVSAPSPPEQISSVAPSALPCVRGHLRSRFGRRPTNGGARRCGVRSRDDAVETAGHVCRPPYRYFSFAQGVRYARRAARARAFLARTRRLFAGSSGRCGNLPGGVGISRRDNVQRSPEPLHSVWDLRRFRRLRFFVKPKCPNVPPPLLSVATLHLTFSMSGSGQPQSPVVRAETGFASAITPTCITQPSAARCE